MTRKLKINIVIGPFYPIPPVRGLAVEKRQYAMALEYAKAGHEVTMISRRFDGFPNHEMRDGVRHIRVPSCDPPKPGLTYRLMDAFYSVIVSLKLPKADVTVTNSVSAPLILPLRKAGRIAVSVGRYPKGQMAFYRRAARLHAASTYIAQAIVQQSPSMRSRVHVVNNAISHDFAQAITSERGPRETEIVYLGRISREKGLDILIRAFKAIAPDYPDWRLTLIGPWEVASGGDGGAFLDELKAIAPELGERVTFTGPIYDGQAIVARLRAADVFVYPSVAEKGEAFGVAPVEAMACGCAIILSALKCFEDFVAPEQNGLVFDHGRNAVANLTEVLNRLLGDSDLRERLGRAATRTALGFTPARIAQAMLEDFERLVADDDR